ncbi:MAG: trypsin-like peptidase domain-containing protein [Acidobacteriota bacterium]|nr:trypsin-like peptidase domain-containing protein [Blastocatellia bacterium]MDW8413260.1 trypsin-like peptidase domain-containing protein [Acidobacteriota bacterium]
MRTPTLAILFLLSTARPLLSQEPSTGQKLALYSKPAVVRVYGAYGAEYYFRDASFTVFTGGIGSGFFINSDGYVATNAHVVDEIHAGEEKAREKLLVQAIKQIGNKYLGDYRKMTTEQIKMLAANLQLRNIKKLNYVQLPNGELMPYEIKAFGAPVGQGKDCAILKIELKNTPSIPIGNSDNVQLQDQIFAIGFPGAVDNLVDYGVLDKKSILEASITDGRVSARKNTADGAPVLQVSAAITHGNSGGPAINEKGEVVGLCTFGSISSEGQEVQGFNFLIPSSTLLEFVRQAGTQNSSGPVDKLYREGLELFWQERYTAAIEKFQEVQGLFPAHSEAQKLIQQARDLKSQGKERTFFSSGFLLLIVGAAVVLLIILGGGIALLIIISKKPAAASANAGRQPQIGYNPPQQARPSPAQMPAPAFPEKQQAFQDAVKTLVAGKTQAPQPTADATIPIAAANFGHLVCTRGILQGQSFPIMIQGISIGRIPGNQIVLPDGRVSSKHAWIGIENGKVVVKDNGSTNGTFVNSIQNRITHTVLNDGDTVIIGDAEVCTLSYRLRKP